MKRFIWFFILFCVVWGQMAQAENRWAVVIGISTYQDSRATLKYTAKDAMTIYDILSTNEYFPKQNIHLLLDEQATQANITRAFRDWLPDRAVSGDIVVIYYSGHGFPGPDIDPKDEADNRDEYLAPYDINLSNPQTIVQSGVRDDLIADWLGKLSSDNIVIFDSCYSGGGIKSILTSGTPKSLEHLLPFQSGTKSLPTTGGMRQELSGLSQRVTFLAASLPSQRSWKDPDLKQSVFTYYLARGLQGNADMNGDGNISVSEAFNYTQQQIASDQKWGHLQQPVIELKKDLVLVSLEPPVQIADTEPTAAPTSIPTVTPMPTPTPIVSIEPTPNPIPTPTPKPTSASPIQVGKIKVDLWFDIIQANGTVKPGVENEEYRSGEILKLSFRAAQDCYLFAFNIDQNGNVYNIHPTDSQADASVRVEGNRIYRVRGTLDKIVGEERFYVVASEHPFSLSQDVLPEVLREFRAKNLQVGQMKDLKIPLSYATTGLKHR